MKTFLCGTLPADVIALAGQTVLPPIRPGLALADEWMFGAAARPFSAVPAHATLVFDNWLEKYHGGLNACLPGSGCGPCFREASGDGLTDRPTDG